MIEVSVCHWILDMFLTQGAVSTRLCTFLRRRSKVEVSQYLSYSTRQSHYLTYSPTSMWIPTQLPRHWILDTFLTQLAVSTHLYNFLRRQSKIEVSQYLSYSTRQSHYLLIHLLQCESPDNFHVTGLGYVPHLSSFLNSSLHPLKAAE